MRGAQGVRDSEGKRGNPASSQRHHIETRGDTLTRKAKHSSISGYAGSAPTRSIPAFLTAIGFLVLLLLAPSAQAASRAYEQVSPPDKGFANVDEAAEGAFKFTIAEDGDAVGYCNAGAGGAQVGVYCGDYITQRTAQGWSAKVIAPPACGQDLEATEPTLGGQKTLALSRNLDYAVIGQPEAVSCGVDPLSADAPLPGNNLYRESLRSAVPSFDLLAPRYSYSPDGRSFNTLNGAYAGGSDDASHLIFESTGDQSDDGLLLNGTRRLFDWHEGEVGLVSRGVDNAPLGVNSSLAGNPDPMASRGQGYGGVSADGKRIFFQSPVDPSNGECLANSCELYLRESGLATYKVSEQECGPACSEGTAPDIFQWANPRGDRVLFKTTAKLVNGDPSAGGNTDLYMYRHPGDPAGDPPASDPANLVLLSADSEPSDGGGSAVQGVLGMGDDGDSVYFVANGQLVLGKPTTAGPKVYRWQWNGGSPTLQFLAILGAANYDRYIWSYSGINRRTMIQRVTPDGAQLLLDTIAPLDPLADQDSTRDVYRWSDPGGWTCLSCQIPGAPSAGESNVKALGQPLTPEPDLPPELQNGQTQNSDPVRVSSDDGRHVFFASMDQLVSEDANTTQDVYEWENGVVSLISGGTDGTRSKLVGTSRSGNDVFFITRDRLVGWDTDNLADVYDARIGGGFPEPVPGLPVCGPGDCRPPVVANPPAVCAGTCVFQGSGDELEKAPLVCRKGSRKVKVKGRVVCKRSPKSQKKQQRHSTRKSR